MKVMKRSKLILTLGMVLLLWSCAPKPVIISVPEEVAPEDQLFKDAEKDFEQNNFDPAMAKYQTYLKQHPQRPFAAAALMRMGAIHNIQENYPAAQAMFKRVITEYPNSALVADAKVEMLALYYKQGQYDTVIQLASGILEEKVSPSHIVKTYTILGDTYLSMEEPQDAVFFYSTAFQASETDAEDLVVVEKINAATQQLDSTQIQELLDLIKSDRPRSYLMYQLGVRLAEESKYENAFEVLTAFVDTYPDHENVSDADRLIEELSEKMVYQRTAIGCLLPLSGPYKVYGMQALKGIETALAKNRMETGVNTIQLIIKDTGSDSDKAAAGMEELVKAQVAAIIGPIVTAQTAAAIAQKNGVPIVTITQKDKITHIGDYVFRNFLTPTMQVQALVTFATEEMGIQNYAILYPQEKYGRTFMNLFWDEVIQHGGNVVGVEAYDPTHTDFAAPIKKLVGLYYDIPEDLKPEKEPEEPKPEEVKRRGNDEEELDPILDFEAVFIPDAPNKAGLIIPQLAFYDIEGVTLLGTNLWHSPKLIEMAKDYVQEAVISDGFFANSTNLLVQSFVERYESMYRQKPGFVAATTYDTALILFDLVSDPAIRSRNALKHRLLNLEPYQGVTGLTTFDESGEVHKQLSLLRVDGEKFVEIDAELN